jgi:ubiquinone/menaquinone biosynthesis C-methylase UbiE
MEATFSTILTILLVIAVLNYLGLVAMERLKPQLIADPGASLQREGFTDAIVQKDTYLTNDELYDEFYASVYDQLTQNIRMTQQKVLWIVNEWKKSGMKMEYVDVLDAGCGTGVGCVALAKMDVRSVLGVDKSKAMLERAKTVTVPQSTLSEVQKQKITFRQGDLLNPSVLGGGAVTHAVCLYFSIYYLQDKDAFFRNMFLWVKPGGDLVVEVVNKYKFDPMLDSASPWMGFSLQKYSKERVTESKVTFDKFEYAGKFDLQDPGAEFRETFRFKDGSTRRQRHRFTMPPINDISKMAQAAGWTYTKFLDLTMIGFEYSYLLFFRHP